MEKIRNLSIRKTIILYMGINLILCFFLSVAIVGGAEAWQQKIWWKYTDQEAFIAASQQEQESDYIGYRVEIPRIRNQDMSRGDLFISELCDMLQTWSMLLIPSIGMVITVFVFYRNKIKKPLRELVKGSMMISNNDLDFTLNYTNKDELGTLCGEFEKMRKELVENNQQMWNMVEQEKTLKAAIAHDIRSPLATLRGYQEMMLEFVPQDQLDQEQLMEILQSGMIQIDRLNTFVDTMAHLNKLENREMQYQKISVEQLARRIRETIVAPSLECIVTTITAERELYLDLLIVLEVAENLISNALRYAEKKVVVELAADNNGLEIIVTDDGAGFQDEADKVTRAYYHTNPRDDLKHFGLGLFICRVYCERHGGKLLIGNHPLKGAQVRAGFRSKPDSEQDRSD